MALPDYRSSASWSQAIDLGTVLLRLAEELPAAEEMGLSHQLRLLAVELPAAAANTDGPEPDRALKSPILKLLAALELIDRVYPALDTASARSAAEQLAASPVAPAVPPPGPKPAATALDTPPAPESAAPQPPVTKVPITPASDPEPILMPASANDVAPTPASSTPAIPEPEEDRVHPDSLQ